MSGNNPMLFKMGECLNVCINNVFTCSNVRTRQRWLSKYTLSDKLSCMFTFVLFMVICTIHNADCSRLNGAYASPCYRLDGNNKPILDKPQVRVLLFYSLLILTI